MRYVFLFLCIGLGSIMNGQPRVIRGATIHTGEGTTISNGIIAWENENIIYVGQGPFALKDAIEINGDSLHIWPGFIALNTYAGLSEIDAARPTKDQYEVGNINPHIRSQIAYNTDSKILPTLRFNGVLFVQPTPGSGLIAGSSSIMRTYGNNWEDATVKNDVALHVYWPWLPPLPNDKQELEYQKQIEELSRFFAQVKSYANNQPQEKNLRFEAAAKVFKGQTKLFIHADRFQMLKDIQTWQRQFPEIKVVIVGGSDAAFVSNELREKNTPVVLGATHRLPSLPQSHVHEFYMLPAQLMNDSHLNVSLSLPGVWETRNLPFQAGQTMGYGMSAEQALQTITLNPAIAAGVDHRIGSLKEKKEATFFATKGNALDMSGNQITKIWILGKEIPVEGPQQKLYQDYQKKQDNPQSFTK